MIQHVSMECSSLSKPLQGVNISFDLIKFTKLTWLSSANPNNAKAVCWFDAITNTTFFDRSSVVCAWQFVKKQWALVCNSIKYIWQ